MNLHEAGTRPAQPLPPPEPTPPPHLTWQQRLVWEFVHRHGEVILTCPSCEDSQEYHRDVQEIWGYREHVTFENDEGDGTRSSAEYEREWDERPWECSNCTYAVQDDHLIDLLNDLEKEVY